MTSVSVIIPTYNRARWLPETVASILGQTRPPAEVIIVDDGSSDDTASACAAFPQPVRYVRQPNAGVSAARNRGIAESSGHWIAFADSDDVWVSTKLEVQLAALEMSSSSRWTASDCQVIDLTGSTVSGEQGFRRTFPLFTDLGVTPEELFGRTLQREELEVNGERHVVYSGDVYGLLFHGNFVLPSTAIVSRETVQAVGKFDESMRVAEDTEFFHRVAAHAPASLVMTPLVRYRVGDPTSLVASDTTLQSVRNAITSLERAAHLRPALSPPEREAYDAGRQRLMLRLAYTLLTRLDGRGARRSIREAWRLGAPRTARGLGIIAASFLPPAALTGLHRLKRRLRV